jgi:probable HAF family extracellular repeat protein
MKRGLVFAILFAWTCIQGAAQATCPEGTLQKVLGTSCSIGSLTFTFSSNFNGFKQHTDLATNTITTEFLDPSVVGFKPVVNGSQVGFQLIANHTDAPSTEANFFNGYNAQIFYTYQASGGAGVSIETATVDASVTGSDTAYAYAFNSQCYVTGFCSVEGPATGIIPGQGQFSDLTQSFALGAPQTQSVDGGNASIGSFAYTTSTATIISGTFLFDTVIIPPPAFTYSTIRYPGAEQTELVGLNNHGDIVGSALINGTWRGFLFQKGSFTLLTQGPLADSQTFPSAINDRGDIVGSLTTADGIQHGFILAAGKVRVFDHPSATSRTVAAGINESGTVVGYFIDQAGVFHAFVYDQGKFQTPTLPGTNTAFFGINARGQIFGWSSDEFFNVEPIIYRDGITEAVTVPGEFPGTAFGDAINNKGDLAVNYYDGFSNVGAVFSRGSWDIVSFPDAFYTIPTGLNNRGQVVGLMDTGEGLVGFIATRPKE